MRGAPVLTRRARRWLRGFAAAFSGQLPICDKFAGWAPWMSFSEPEVPEVQRLSALQKLPRKLLVLREGPDLTARFFARSQSCGSGLPGAAPPSPQPVSDPLERASAALPR